MISSITIQNFETHIDTRIDLHDGVNAFVGESDEGKSGIIRALKWNTQNRPQGDAYRNDQLDPKKDKKVLCSVEVNYKNDGIVLRQRDNISQGINNYTINNGKPLKALRTDIPKEVQDVTQMKDFNIQVQHPTEQYFLLADKPGQVAKKFNKVSGLSIIDDTTSEINSKVRETNATLKVIKKEIEDRELQLKNMEWVPAATKQAKNLKIKKSKLKQRTHKIDKLNSLLEQLDYVDSKLEKFNNLDEALQELNYLEQLDNKIWAAAKQQKLISDPLDGLKTIDIQLKASNGIESALQDLKQLERLNYKISDYEVIIDKLDYKLKEIDVNKMHINKHNEIYNELEKEFNKRVESEVCPTCGRTGK